MSANSPSRRSTTPSSTPAREARFSSQGSAVPLDEPGRRALRRRKDEAVDAMARGQHARAATLLSAVAETDDDPYWSHRAGESYLRLAEPATARRLLERAAAGYRARGHAAKANAIDKMIAALPSAPR